jgi:hypothetical protein
VRTGSLEIAPAIPVPWPEPWNVSSACRNLDLSLPSPTPDWIEVYGYEKVNPTTEEPSLPPSHTTECNSFGTASPCTFSTDQTGEVLRLDVQFLRYPYLIVFASWFVPSDFQALGPDARPRVTASCLFRIDPA